MDDDDADLLIADLEALLRIDEHSLEQALQQHPDAFYRVSRQLALEESRRDALRQYVKDAEASAYLQFKADAEKAGDKLTASELNAMVRVDTDVQDVVDKLLAKERTVGKLKALEAAMKQRKYALQDLVELFLNNYYSDPSGGRPQRRELKERQRNAIREEQQAQRDERRRGMR